MSTAAVIECAGGCRVSMRQSSMLRLMIKPFMSIVGNTKDIRYVILTYSAYCDFQSQDFRKWSAQQNKSIHIFRGFQKQITSQNPEDDASENHLIVLYVLRTSMLQHITLQPKTPMSIYIYLLYQRFHRTVSFLRKTIMYCESLVRHVNWRVDDTYGTGNFHFHQQNLNTQWTTCLLAVTQVRKFNKPISSTYVIYNE